jgi:hypothetical protein
MLAQLDHDPSTAHFVGDCAGGTGAGERVEDEVVGVAGDVNDSLKQAFGLWRSKRLNVRKKLIEMISLGLLISSYLRIPPCSRGHSIAYLSEISLNDR